MANKRPNGLFLKLLCRSRFDVQYAHADFPLPLGRGDPFEGGEG